MFHPTPHKNSTMVFWPVVRSLHRFCKRKRSWSWTCLCWVRLTGGLPTAFCWIIVRTVAFSFWHHSITRHIDGWACPTRLQNLLFQPSHRIFKHVVGSGITVDCGIMYVPNGWRKHRWAASKDQTDCLILCWILLSKSTTDVSWIKVIKELSCLWWVIRA